MYNTLHEVKMTEQPVFKFGYRTLMNNKKFLEIEEKIFSTDMINSTVQKFIIEKTKFFNNYIYSQLTKEELLKMKSAIEEELNKREH